MSNHIDSPWTPEHNAILAELCKTAMPTRVIALEINARTGSAFTKNAVISHSRRMGMLKDKPTAKHGRRPGSPNVKPRKKGMDGGMAYRVANSRRRKEVKPQTFREAVASVEPLNIPFMDRVYGQCAFPTKGAGMHMLVCGHVAPDGEPYCSAHAAVCYEHRRAA